MQTSVLVDVGFVFGCLAVAFGLVLHWIAHRTDA